MSRRRLVSPVVMPYCNVGGPVLGDRNTRFSRRREVSTGKVALSVKPAASEINSGRDNAACMSQEMGGNVVRRPKADKAVFIFDL